MTGPTPNPEAISLPRRRSDGHKGTFGTVAVIGGSARNPIMLGAPALAARAALRSGTGRTIIAAPAPILPAILNLCPSATGHELALDDHRLPETQHAVATVDTLARSTDVMVVGPGLGCGSGTADERTTASTRAITNRAIAQEDAAVVIDADALNALAQTPDWRADLRAPAVLTPHPGEFARLAPAFGINPSPTTDDERADACTQLAARTGSVVVLKGHRTVVSDSVRTWVCDEGGSELAIGGSGDVLAGAVAGIAAQLPKGPLGELDLFGAARAAVLAHARAGKAWCDQHSASAGMLAAELADLLPKQIELLRTDAV